MSEYKQLYSVAVDGVSYVYPNILTSMRHRVRCAFRYLTLDSITCDPDKLQQTLTGADTRDVVVAHFVHKGPGNRVEDRAELTYSLLTGRPFIKLHIKRVWPPPSEEEWVMSGLLTSRHSLTILR